MDESGIRAHEIARILSAEARGNVLVVVFVGPAGAGKTWLARQVLSAAAAQGRLVGTGKYGEAEAQSALGPIMDALSGLLEKALDRFYLVQTGIASLTDALGVDLEVLISAGLTTPGIVAQGSLQALSDRRSGVYRTALAVAKLLTWLEGFGAPRVILIDDWQRASNEARELLRMIAGSSGNQPLTIILTQRDGEGEPQTSFGVETIVRRLDPLSDDEVRELLCEHLGSKEKAAVFMTFFGDAIPRRPFHLLEVADAVSQADAWKQSASGWVLDRATVNCLEFDALTRLKRLDPSHRHIVMNLAIWGDSAPLDAFQKALGASQASRHETDIAALIEAAIVDVEDGRISFRHDLLRQASLDLGPFELFQKLAAGMAELLPEGDDLSEVEIAALHLRRLAGIGEISAESWRERFARGSAAARGRSDMAAAASFAETALTLRDRSPKPSRDMDRLIFREAVFAAADRDGPETAARAYALIATGRSLTELCQDYQIGVTALRFAGQSERAWRLACEGLRRVGVMPPPSRPMPAMVISALRWLTRSLWSRSRGPEDPEQLDAFTAFAAVAATIAYHRDPRGTAVLGFQAAAIAGRRSAGSAYWHGVDAFLFAILGQQNKAAQAGARALESFAAQRVMRAASLYQAVFFGTHWAQPLKTQRGYFPEVTRLGFEEGDLLMAAYSVRIDIMSGWRTTDNLHRLLDEAKAAHATLRRLGEESFSDEMESMVEVLEGLTGGRPWDPSTWRRDLPARNHVIDLELSNLAGDFHETLRRARELRPLRASYSLQVDSVVMRFHEALAKMRCGLKIKAADLAFIRRAVQLNPADHRPKLLLLEAEMLRQRGADHQRLMAAYAVAVDAALQADSRLDAAMATGCAAAAAMALSDKRLSMDYQGRTDTILRRWGVTAGASLFAATISDGGEAEARAVAAERADHAKSQLLIHVAHELRTPLQALQTLLDVTKMQGGVADLGEIRDVVASLRGVVDDLNITSGLADDTSSDQTSHVDLVELIRSEIGVWRTQGSISLESSSPPPPLTVPADRLRQIIRNLLSNAVKYGEQTPIEISLRSQSAGGELMHVEVSVQDQGPGIPAGEMETLFEPFHRGARAGDGRGAGLGLSLARRIAERIGGTLTAANNAAGGACFTLTFTAQKSPTQTLRLQPKPLSVLLVEDTDLIRRLLRTMLEGLGHTVTEAADAATALRTCATHPFDLIILDIGLPDASGLSVLSAVRKGDLPGAPRPVLLLTASTSGEAEAAGKTYAAVRVLRKPASAKQLAEAISALAGAASSQPETPSHLEELLHIDRCAKAEIIARVGAILDGSLPATKECIHQLAGLASQFAWPDVASAVEALGAAVASGQPISTAQARLRLVVESLDTDRPTAQ